MKSASCNNSAAYKENILNLLYHRATGTRYRNRKGINIKSRVLDLHALKLLICSTSRSFKKMAPTVSNKGEILYDNGKLLLRNRVKKSMDCLSVIENFKKIINLWSVESTPSNRWEDHAILQTDLHLDYNKPSLLVLKSTSNLERYDLKTGSLLATLKLYKDVKFSEMSVDEDMHWLILKSVKTSTINNPSSDKKKDITVRFMILDLLPLQYKYHIVFKQSNLEINFRDIIISNGLIMILKHSKHEIECYSLLPILEQATAKEVSKVDGFYPNIEVKELGPCLFSTTSYQHFLILHECQWTFLRKQNASEFQLCNLKDSKIIGRFFTSTNLFDDHDQVQYLADNSGRLITAGNASVKIYSTERWKSDIKEIFRYEADFMKVPSRDNDIPEFSRSGRKIRRSIDLPPTEFTSVKFDYEDELDILGLLIVTDQLTDQEERAQTMLTIIKEVRLYDGHKFDLLRVIPINFTAVRPCTDVSGSVQLCLDRDVVIIKIKGSTQTIMVPYQLCETNSVLPMIDKYA